MALKVSREFKHEVVQVALTSGLSRRQIASDFDIGFSTLGRWIKEERERDQVLVSGPQDDLIKENERLRVDNRLLREEREVLKKATVDSMDEGNTLLYYPYKTNLRDFNNEKKILTRRKRHMLEVMATRVGF